MIVQVNGKVKSRLEVDASIDDEAAIQLALGDETIQRLLDGAVPSRVIARPPVTVNIVP